MRTIDEELRETDISLKRLLMSVYLTQLKFGAVTAERLSESIVGKAAESSRLLLTLASGGFVTRISSRDVEEGSKERRLPAGEEYKIAVKGRELFTVVAAGGVFDLVHVGHLATLNEAKKLGDLLVVVIAKDVTVEKGKGERPIFPETERKLLVEALKPVDMVLLGYEDAKDYGYEQIINVVQPDVIALGYDQGALEEAIQGIVARRKLNIKLVRLPKYEGRTVSSSLIRGKISGLTP